MMNKLRVAIVGCGAVSKNHGKALTNNEYADLCYAVDIDEEKAKAFSLTYGGEVLTDYENLFDKDIDVIHVVTPHNTHPEIVINALKHGINVFTEKPLAITPFDAKRMIAESKVTGMKLGVCFQNRLNKATVLAKEIIENKQYGEIISAMAIVAWDRHGDYYSKSAWRGTYEGEGGGVLINQSIHTIDLVDYLLGGVSSVTGMDGKFRETNDYEVEDFGMGLLKLNGGQNCVVFCTNCYPKSKICTLEVHLEKATLTIKQSGLLIEEENGKTIFHEAETLKGDKSEWGVNHSSLINEFYKSLINNTPFLAEAKTGLKAVEIVNALQHSKGKEIKLS